MNNLFSLVFIILIGLLFISKSYELNDQVLADNSLTVKDIPKEVILNDEVDNHIIEKRQKSGKAQKKKNKKRRQRNASLRSIAILVAQLQQQLNNVQAQIMQLTTTTTAPPVTP
ncbi:Hypothetical protein SRAE_0000056300 [Strongyloides ratti]|uniref:Secreted protein n=1 Tax=Strongyloides ratti TaxID=34506 RepID=A0A090L1R7_STRRB|nr:Hypothetical protein SRAE_0000056300 [Strongyloides ratti]CEF61439.1 Hypothetical protein SRAE_0000056300 [Strongyloides ratti]